MPIFSPRSFQQAYLPIEQDRQWFVRAFTALERTGKGLLFGCRMCGTCILQETAFICPMTCAKGLRNGFCGEATEERCVVDASRPCTWLQIFRRSERMGRMDRLLEINAPVDGSQAGHSARLPFARYWSERKQPFLPDFFSDRNKFNQAWDGLCYEFRQPAWWQGDNRYHPAPAGEPVSKLEAALRSHPFVMTSEIEPAMDANASRLASMAQLFKKYVVSANYSDNAFATTRMGSLACSKLSLEAGFEPVMQIQPRDRSRNGILADVLGASALGIRNILCLGGNFSNDGPRPWPYQPEQFDIDSIQMLWMLRRLRDEGKHIDGREVPVRPQYFLGAAASPFTLSPTYNAIRVEKKINAGAQFIQTQMIFEHEGFTEWLEALDKRSLLDKVYILAGVWPLRSLEETRFFGSSPGIYIPHKILERMEKAAGMDGPTDGNQFQITEGVQIAVEMIEKLIHTPGIHGVHLMLGGQEEILPRIFEEASLEAAV